MKKKDEIKESQTVFRQFDEMKQKHPDSVLLFRAGDKYETYRQDAIKAKQILGLDIETKEIEGKKVDMAAFEHNKLDTNLPRLVRAGMRVVICEMLEDRKQKKTEKEKVNASTKENTVSNNDETQLTNTTMARKNRLKASEQEALDQIPTHPKEIFDYLSERLYI